MCWRVNGRLFPLPLWHLIIKKCRVWPCHRRVTRLRGWRRAVVLIGGRASYRSPTARTWQRSTGIAQRTTKAPLNTQPYREFALKPRDPYPDKSPPLSTIKLLWTTTNRYRIAIKEGIRITMKKRSPLINGTTKETSKKSPNYDWSIHYYTLVVHII